MSTNGSRSPDELLAQIRLCLSAIAQNRAIHEPVEALGLQLAGLTAQLDSWLSAGGTPPADWQPTKSWQQAMRQATSAATQPWRPPWL
jgi:hypothetical protein